MAFNYKCGQVYQNNRFARFFVIFLLLYSDTQFDDSFSPKRLGNWGGNCRPNRRLRTRHGPFFRQKLPRYFQPIGDIPQDFIANDCGHLLPDVKDNISKKTNHWGQPIVSVWDELFQCCDGHSRKKKTCQKDFTRSLEGEHF